MASEYAVRRFDPLEYGASRDPFKGELAEQGFATVAEAAERACDLREEHPDRRYSVVRLDDGKRRCLTRREHFDVARVYFSRPPGRVAA